MRLPTFAPLCVWCEAPCAVFLGHEWKAESVDEAFRPWHADCEDEARAIYPDRPLHRINAERRAA